MAIAYLGLGANIDQPAVQLERALEALNQHPQIELLTVSPWYASAPVGPQDQPDFINGACKIDTSLSAFDLLAALKDIEQAFGRVKTRHWGERCIDLDILLYEQERIDTETLTIPHPELCHRAFVLLPLNDIAADISHPTNGLCVKEISIPKDQTVMPYRPAE